MARDDLAFDTIGNTLRAMNQEPKRPRARRIDPITFLRIEEEGDFQEEIEEERIEKLREDLIKRTNRTSAKDYHVVRRSVKDFKFSTRRRYIPAPNVPGAANYKRHSRQLTFFNNTGTLLTIVYRDNVKVELPPQTGIRPSLSVDGTPTEKELGGLVVEVTDAVPVISINPYMFGSAGVTETLGEEVAGKMLTEISKIESPILGDITSECSFNYYHIVDGTFIKNKGTVYDKELDVLIFKGSSLEAPNHPANDTDVVTAFYNNDEKHVDCSSVTFDIIDNDDEITGKRYVFAGGKVIPIPVRKDPSKETGLHVITRVGATVKTEVVEIERLSEFGVYGSKEEAMTAGDPSIAHKERIQTLAKETEELKAKNLKLVAENNRLSEEIKGRTQDAELKFLEEKNRIEANHKQAMAKLREDFERMKARYEKEKLERQAKIEKLTFMNNVLKGIVAVTTAALGVVVLIYRNTAV